MMGYTTDCLPRVGLTAANSGKLVVTGFNSNMPPDLPVSSQHWGLHGCCQLIKGRSVVIQGRGYHIYPRQCQRGEKGEKG